MLSHVPSFSSSRVLQGSVYFMHQRFEWKKKKTCLHGSEVLKDFGVPDNPNKYDLYSVALHSHVFEAN